MYKSSLLLFAIASFCCLYSCKKENAGNGNTNGTNSSSLIVGKWLATTEHARIYTTGGTLVKDTTDIFANDQFNPAWFEIYNKSGDSYVTSSIGAKVDTTSFFTYSIADKELKIYEEGQYSYSETILTLNSTNMEKEDNYTSIADSRWNLPANSQYKFILDIAYTKQ